MTVYTAPLDEMRFVLYEVLGADKLLAVAGPRGAWTRN